MTTVLLWPKVPQCLSLHGQGRAIDLPCKKQQPRKSLMSHGVFKACVYPGTVYDHIYDSDLMILSGTWEGFLSFFSISFLLFSFVWGGGRY